MLFFDDLQFVDYQNIMLFLSFYNGRLRWKIM